MGTGKGWQAAATRACVPPATHTPPAYLSPPPSSPPEAAKDCVRRMLVRDPKRRATAQQILQHEWMRENGVATDQPIQLEVLSRMKQFSAMNRLKKEALKVRSRRSSGRQQREHARGGLEGGGVEGAVLPRQAATGSLWDSQALEAATRHAGKWKWAGGAAHACMCARAALAARQGLWCGQPSRPC